MNKWVRRYLLEALFKAEWSKDPSTKVGCVISTEDYTPISQGFNGFPRKMKDHESRYTNREFKYKFVLHAEENAMAFANRSLEGCQVFLTHPPCTKCLALMSQRGITKITYIEPEENFKERWQIDLVLSMANELGIDIISYKKEEVYVKEVQAQGTRS